MTTKYQRIPLIVDALFMTDGSFQPLKLIYSGTTVTLTGSGGNGVIYAVYGMN